jgi:hypothetical protein
MELDLPTPVAHTTSQELQLYGITTPKICRKYVKYVKLVQFGEITVSRNQRNSSTNLL